MSVNELVKRAWGLSEKVLPYRTYRYLVFMWKKIKLCGKKWPYQEEFFLKYRPFSKKAYCIIRLEFPAHSLFTAAKRYIFAAEYVKSKGMYPIMDLEWDAGFKRGLLKENMWEGVFYQKKSRNVLSENATIMVCRVNKGAGWYSSSTCMDVNGNLSDPNIHVKEEDWRNYYSNINKYIKKYMKFNQLLVHEVCDRHTELFQGEKNVLGVALREDFSQEFYDQLNSPETRKIYEWHPSGPNVDEVMNIVEEAITKWNCNKILVGTAYVDTIDRFQERFPGRIIYLQRERRIMSDCINEINTRKDYRDNPFGRSRSFRRHRIETLREYAMETLLLSKCDYFIGAVSAQSAMALSINGGEYKDIKVLEDRNHIERY